MFRDINISVNNYIIKRQPYFYMFCLWGDFDNPVVTKPILMPDRTPEHTPVTTDDMSVDRVLSVLQDLILVERLYLAEQIMIAQSNGNPMDNEYVRWLLSYQTGKSFPH